MNAAYNIKLPQFEGPFDLLLFFIERDELDIHDIPIAKITEDFLAFVRQLESLNIDLASEFILVAATLMRIKAKMLIPRKPVDEEGNEIDPRDELVARLLEYKRYKSVLDDMRKLEEDRSFRTPRGYASKELRQLATKALVDVELEQLTLFKLMKTFQSILNRFEKNKNRKPPVHKVFTYRYTIYGQQQYIYSKVKIGERTSFEDIFSSCVDRMHAIITFLGLLELLNLQKLTVLGGEGINNLWVTMEIDQKVTEDVVHDDEDEMNASLDIKGEEE